MTIAKFNNIDNVKRLLTTLPYSARALKVNENWRGPKLSGRKLKELYNSTIKHGLEWPMQHPKENKSKKNGLIKNFKGSMDLRKQDSR
jgi:hypothetical protein